MSREKTCRGESSIELTPRSPRASNVELDFIRCVCATQAPAILATKRRDVVSIRVPYGPPIWVEDRGFNHHDRVRRREVRHFDQQKKLVTSPNKDSQRIINEFRDSKPKWSLASRC